MIFSSAPRPVIESIQTILLVFLIFCSFLYDVCTATVLVPLKECQPFTCLREPVDRCEIRTHNSTAVESCRQLMWDFCEQVEENDRNYIDQCHNGIHTEGEKCVKCEIASRMCRELVDNLPTEVHSVSIGVSKTIEELVRRSLQFSFSGGGRCKLCFGDDSDNRR